MPLLTFIARVTDGRLLVASIEHMSDNQDTLDVYKSQAKQIFRKLNPRMAAKCSIESGPYTFHYVIEAGVCFLTLTDKDGDTTTLTQDEYQRFCEKIGEWLPMLGAATESQEALPSAAEVEEVAAPSRLSSRYSDRPEEHKEPTTGDEELDDATFAQRYPEAHRASQAEAAEAEAVAARSAAKARAGGSSACLLL